MKAWMTDDAKRDFPTLDRVVFRILAEADNSLKRLPELKFDGHKQCFANVCEGLRVALDDEQMPIMIPARLLEITHQHVVTTQKMARNWDTVLLLITWEMLQNAAIALHGATGNGLIRYSEGKQIEVHGNDAVMYGLTGVLTHMHCLRYCAENPELTHGRPLGEMNSLADIQGLEPLNRTKPQWAVDMLDQGLPDGAPKLSEMAFAAGVTVRAAAGDGLATQH